MNPSDQLAQWLHDQRELIISRVQAELELAPETVALPCEEFCLIYDALGLALATAEYGPLDQVLLSWVRQQSEIALLYRAPLLPVIAALKASLWDLLPQQLEVAEALAGLKVLEPLLTHAAVRLTDLQAQSAQAKLTEELQATKRHLERLDKSKSDFIAIAAHELKTPLTLIEGYASMLMAELDSDGDTRQQMLLTGIRNGARRLAEIVQDMIDVAMIDTAGMALRYQPVRIRRLVELVANEWRPHYAERRVSLLLGELDDGGRITFADSERLHQVFNTIFGNSLKYTPDGGQVVVTARTLPGQGAEGRAAYVEIMVRDNGIGIASEDLERIFQKFERLDSVALHSSGKARFKGGGPGLDLAIAKGVIEAHGGMLWVESPGVDALTCRGSTFHALLPLHYEPPEDKSGRLLGMSSGQPAGTAAK